MCERRGFVACLFTVLSSVIGTVVDIHLIGEGRHQVARDRRRNLLIERECV